MSRKIDGNLTKSGPVPSLPLRRNHEKQSRIRGRKHMLYVVFPPRFNMFPFRFHLRNQVISSCVLPCAMETSFVASARQGVTHSTDLISLYTFLCLQELIQNAEDAGATKVKFLHDKNSYGTAQLYDDCEELSECQVKKRVIQRGKTM